MDTIGSRIAHARRLVDGLSASELAKLAGLHRTHLSNIENEVRDGVEGKTAVAIARVLGVSTDWLLTGEGGEPEAEAVALAVEKARATKAAS